MNLHLEYITDTNGKHKAVVIPQKEWLKFQDYYNKLVKKLEILTGIENAMKEVSQIRNDKKKGKSLSTFLDEV